MAKGRKTGGRQKGTRNRRSQELIGIAEAGGEMPLDYMLAYMRNPRNSKRERLFAAVNAAPYVHSKLANIKHSGDAKQPIQVVVNGSAVDG